MQTKTFSLIFGAALFAVGARAANSSSPTIATPSSPAPVYSAPAPSMAAAPAPNQVVYTPRLPSPADLTNAATAQGLTIERMEQSAAQIVVVYKTSNGQVNTVAYQTLPPAGSAASATVVAPATSPAPVVYESAPRVAYYDSYDPFYYSPVWYPPVSLRLGFGYGFRGGFRGGGFHHWR